MGMRAGMGRLARDLFVYLLLQTVASVARGVPWTLGYK